MAHATAERVSSGVDIRTVQALLALSDVKTTMIYRDILNRRALGVGSPITHSGRGPSPPSVA
jgi:site-specific recombinase XerD